MAYRPIESKSLANEEYDKALRQAFWRDLFRRLRSRCDDLVPASELLEQLTVLRQRDLGLQEVSLNLIIGSGRFWDFNYTSTPKGGLPATAGKISPRLF